jgi:FkbM family methyltransferase
LFFDDQNDVVVSNERGRGSMLSARPGRVFVRIKASFIKHFPRFSRVSIEAKKRIFSILRRQPERVNVAHEKEQPPFGIVESQGYFELLLRKSLEGMNFGYDAIDNGERHLLAELRRNLPDGVPYLFDVGANVGNYTAMLLENFGDAMAKIHAFEPSSLAFRRLEQRYRDSQHVVLNNFGLADRDGTAVLYSDREGSEMSSLTERRLSHHGIEVNQTEDVSLRTLEGYAKEKNVDRIYLLKIDVEGHELDVLKGAGELLGSGRIENIAFEFGGADIDSRVFIQDFYYLLHPNYELFRIVRDGIYPLGEYSEYLEVFCYANYYARLRKS